MGRRRAGRLPWPPLEARRTLGAFTAAALGVNAIVGSGVYLFPGTLAERLGLVAMLPWILTAVLCAPIALAYAELARDHDRSGGTYRYAAAAFGAWPGALLGWVSWVSVVVSWGAVANAAPNYLGELLPALGPGTGGKIAAAVMIAALTAINWRGVRMGAGVSNAFTVGKLVPLTLLAAGALVPLFREASPAPARPGAGGSVPDAVFLVLFAYQGFEVVGITAGEMRDPKKDVRNGVLWSMGLATLLYCLVQQGYLAAGSPGGDAPLANAARSLWGGWAGWLLGVGGLVSIVGFNAGTAVGSPRYLSALAEDGFLPRKLAEPHPRFGTPALAIWITGGTTLVCAVFMDFEALVALANVSVLVQYLATSAALVVVRRSSVWRAVGLAACAACVAMLTRAKREEFVGFGAAMLVGTIVLPLLRRK